jgi:hypothetical protein
MRLDDRGYLIVVSGIVILLAVWIPLITPYLPSKDEPFFELAILGENDRAEHYFPDDDPSIDVEEQVNWSIHVYNHMGKTQYVSLRLKLLNSTDKPPISAKCSPSPLPFIYEIKQGLEKNETILIPLSWSIKKIDNESGYTNIKSISINNENIEVDILDTIENSFRIIIELWVYHERSEEFEFGWESDEGKRCAWTQLWFNANSE